jgi:hypothetical protein
MNCRFPLVEERASQEPCPQLMRSPGESEAREMIYIGGPLES